MSLHTRGLDARLFELRIRSRDDHRRPPAMEVRTYEDCSLDPMEMLIENRRSDILQKGLVRDWALTPQEDRISPLDPKDMQRAKGYRPPERGKKEAAGRGTTGPDDPGKSKDIWRPVWAGSAVSARRSALLYIGGKRMDQEVDAFMIEIRDAMAKKMALVAAQYDMGQEAGGQVDQEMLETALVEIREALEERLASGDEQIDKQQIVIDVLEGMARKKAEELRRKEEEQRKLTMIMQEQKKIIRDMEELIQEVERHGWTPEREKRRTKLMQKAQAIQAKMKK